MFRVDQSMVFSQDTCYVEQEQECLRSYSEVVFEGVAWRNFALRHAHRAVHVRGAVHEEAVKVQRGRLVAKLVVDIDDNAIANVCLNARNGPLVVDANDGTRERSVWVGRDPSDVEVIVDSGRTGEAQRGSEQRRRSSEAIHVC